MRSTFWFEFASTYSFPAAMRIEHAAAQRGVAIEWKPFLLGPIFAARVALAAEAERWLPEFVRTVYEANFAYDRDIPDRAVIGELLQDLGLPAAVWLERAESTDVKARLRARTEEAQRRGIFGAPSFLVSDELFWGNDRLEYALDWAESQAT